MKVLAIIPARYGSSRLEAKPLIKIAGRSLIRWVYENIASMSLFDDIIIATDDQRIVEEVKSFKAKVYLTSTDYLTGTDRCAEVLQKEMEKGNSFDVVVNIQGDEPTVRITQLTALLNLFQNDQVEIATLCTEIRDMEQVFDPSVVKVVKNKSLKALYFSRHGIPFHRDQENINNNLQYFKHIGIYAFRPSTLLEITQLPAAMLERSESLEQLRWLENDYDIYVEETLEQSIGIDTEEDVKKFREYLEQ